MCGVFGFVATHPQSRQHSLNDLEKGMAAIRHRGPDGSGTWVSSKGRAALGHLRLAIIDLDTGAQPMVSDDGRYVIVFNGEIYNYI